MGSGGSDVELVYVRFGHSLSIGFGTVTFGSMLAGVVDRPLTVSGTDALAVESALTAVGFAVIRYSLYAD